MNSFERWMLRRIVRKEVRQDYDHDKKIAALFGMIISAARREFSEDNEPTSQAYLMEWFERALAAKEGVK